MSEDDDVAEEAARAAARLAEDKACVTWLSVSSGGGLKQARGGTCEYRDEASAVRYSKLEGTKIAKRRTRMAELAARDPRYATSYQNYLSSPVVAYTAVRVDTRHLARVGATPEERFEFHERLMQWHAEEAARAAADIEKIRREGEPELVEKPKRKRKTRKQLAAERAEAERLFQEKRAGWAAQAAAAEAARAAVVVCDGTYVDFMGLRGPCVFDGEGCLRHNCPGTRATSGGW